MYKIEFNDEMTVESIMSSFKNLADSKIDCYIEIGDTIIKGDEEDLLVKVTKAYKEYMKNRTSQEEKREINVQTDIRTWDPKDIKEYNDLFNQRNDVYLLRENMVFTFQLGIISKYVKKEYVERLKEFYCGVDGQAWE